MEQSMPRRHADRLPFELKLMWRREEHAKLHAMPREQRRGWLRTAWSQMSEPQKQAKMAELQARWNALPPNVQQTLLEKKRQKREARRMQMQRGGQGKQGQMEQPAERMQH
jgi:hypothetical protein